MQLKILIAEDYKETADVYKKILQDRGHDVTLTYDGQECINRYKNEIKLGNQKNSLPYDVVLVDFAMPKKDGATLVGEILDERPNQRILFATAHGTSVVKEFHKIRRPVELLKKPFKMNTLVRGIESKVSPNTKPRFVKETFRKWDGIAGFSEI